MFSNGSRYFKVKEYSVAGPDGRQVALKRARVVDVPNAATTYQVKDGDRLDLLAFKFYRSARKWWLLADANPQLMYPDDLLVPGQIINVPRDSRG